MPTRRYPDSDLDPSSVEGRSDAESVRRAEAPPVVFVVDDDDSVRKGLSRLLRSAGWIVEAFPSAADFLASADPQGPSCLVLDVRMPDVTGLELQEALTRDGVDIPIVFITGHGTVPDSVRAMKGGAVDFIQKPVDEKDLLTTVDLAIDRDRAGIDRRTELEQLRRRLARLTPREREVFGHVVHGSRNKRIAFTLGVSEKTIKVHRARVMTKMRADSLAHLVRMATLLGIPSMAADDQAGRLRS